MKMETEIQKVLSLSSLNICSFYGVCHVPVKLLPSADSSEGLMKILNIVVVFVSSQLVSHQ